jgi:hypothetical protein
MDRINFRTEPGNTLDDWAKHKQVPLDVYKTLLENVNVSKMLKEGSATYNDFIKSIQPPNEDDGPLLFFLHGARDKNMRELLEELYPEKKINLPLYERMMDYTIHEHEDVSQVVRDVGFMIVNADMPNVEQLYLYKKPTKIIEADIINNTDIKSKKMVLKQVETSEDWSDNHEKALRRNPVMIQYRNKAGLASHFPSRKALKQYLVIAIASDKVGALNDNTLGKKQTHGKLPSSVDLTDSHEDWMQALSVLNGYPPQDINSMSQDPQAHYFYNLLASAIQKQDLESMDTRDFLQLWITAHSGNGWETRWNSKSTSNSLKRAVKKYLARYPEPPQSLITFLTNGPQ